MSKISMVSHAKHSYNGKLVMPNQRFSVDTEQDAAELEALRFADRIPEGQEPGRVATRDLKAEDKADKSDKPDEQGSRRNYTRRDMQAERH